ncbi:MAG: PLP-dependent cysteine synthase family protein [Gemmiger sp.]
MAILRSYYQDVYKCPVVELGGFSGRHGLPSSILAYLDFGGATGTCKDGVAETMLALATERGTLTPGMPVVEASSGSFGAALAVSCATTGHPCILVVPSTLPVARRQQLQALGARIVVCSDRGGRRALERVAADTAKKYNGYFTNYFANDDNPEYHRRVTGPLIYKAAGDSIDAVIVGVGSGGTITGVAEYLKAWNSLIRIVAVEPSECAAISGGFIGHHGIAGIGPGFIPENYNQYVVDTVLQVSTPDAERAAKEALFFDGVPACVSAGATLAAAVQLMQAGKSSHPLCVFSGRRTYE